MNRRSLLGAAAALFVTAKAKPGISGATVAQGGTVDVPFALVGEIPGESLLLKRYDFNAYIEAVWTNHRLRPTLIYPQDCGQEGDGGAATPDDDV